MRLFPCRYAIPAISSLCVSSRCLLTGGFSTSLVAILWVLPLAVLPLVPATAAAQSQVHQITTNGLTETVFIEPGTQEVKLVAAAPANHPVEVVFTVDGPNGIRGTASRLVTNLPPSQLVSEVRNSRRWQRAKLVSASGRVSSSFTTGSVNADPCAAIQEVDLLYTMYQNGFFAGQGFPAGYTKNEFCQRFVFANGGGSSGGSDTYSVGTLPDLCSARQTTSAALVTLNFSSVPADVRATGFLLRVSSEIKSYTGSRAAALKPRSEPHGKFRGRPIFLFSKAGYSMNGTGHLVSKICKGPTCRSSTIPMRSADDIVYRGQYLWRTGVPSTLVSVRRGEARSASVFLMKDSSNSGVASYGHCFQRRRVRQNMGGYDGPAS